MFTHIETFYIGDKDSEYNIYLEDEISASDDLSL